MPARTPITASALLAALAKLNAEGHIEVSSTALAQATGASWSAVKRSLAELVSQGSVQVEGRARATRYRLADVVEAGSLHRVAEPEAAWGASGRDDAVRGEVGGQRPAWTPSSIALRDRLSTAPTARAPVTYQRDFVDAYKPNQSSLLPPQVSQALMDSGRLPEQLPAGTYARKVLEQLLIDLSWSSSRLEGNRYSLLDTEQLFRSGRAATDHDGVMLLNHKAAIEFLVDAVPTQGLTTGLLQNLHAILLRDLLPDLRSLGAVRTRIVNISGSAFVPAQDPHLLREMFERIVGKAQSIKNPIEAAFFLWVNLAYLQPFEDGNKRVSRLAANIPLMLYNHAPLSFVDVDRQDYALAMMGVYEFRDVSMAADLFAWTYRRSQAKYRVVLEAMGAPDPFRMAHRERLNQAILMVVRERRSTADAIHAMDLPADDTGRFRRMLEDELASLEDYNCARYRLQPRETAEWIRDGRPH